MSAAERILERMRSRTSGWKPKDFETLYRGFGFEKREGSGHTRYQHRKYRDLIATVARHPKLSPGYAADAVERIDELKRRQAREEDESGTR